MEQACENIGNQAWEELKKNRGFTSEIPPKAIHVYEPIVVGLPQFAGRQILGAKADLKGVINAKIIFLKYAVEQNLTSKFLKAAGLSGEMLPLFDKAVSGAVEMFSSVAQDIPGYLEEVGYSEEAALVQIGFNQELLDKLAEGLTVGELYAKAPMIIIKNTE